MLSERVQEAEIEADLLRRTKGYGSFLFFFLVTLSCAPTLSLSHSRSPLPLSLSLSLSSWSLSLTLPHSTPTYLSHTCNIHIAHHPSLCSSCTAKLDEARAREAAEERQTFMNETGDIFGSTLDHSLQLQHRRSMRDAP